MKSCRPASDYRHRKEGIARRLFDRMCRASADTSARTKTSAWLGASREPPAGGGPVARVDQPNLRNSGAGVTRMERVSAHLRMACLCCSTFGGIAMDQRFYVTTRSPGLV
jgi:hypothetical protein